MTMAFSSYLLAQHLHHSRAIKRHYIPDSCADTMAIEVTI
jgi:hypothetical protein